MEYINTIYINCRRGHVPELHNSEVIRFDTRNCHGYALFAGLFGSLFAKAFRLQESGILEKPYCASIVLPRIEKFKEEDPETNMERIRFILKNLVPPKKGIIISIYLAEENQKFITPFTLDTIWSFKNRWENIRTQEFVVIQDIKDVKNNKKHHLDWKKGTISVDNIKRELDSVNVPYEVIDYSTSIQKVFYLLLNCKMFLTPHSGAYFLAAGLNTPTVCFGESVYSKTNDYLETNNIGLKLKEKVLSTPWGRGPYNQHAGRITIGNGETIYQGKQEYTKANIGNVENNEDYDVLRKMIMEYC